MSLRPLQILIALCVIIAAALGFSLFQSLVAARENFLYRAIATPHLLAQISFGKSRAGFIVTNPYTAQVFAAMEDVPALASMDAKSDTIVQEIPLSGYHTGMALNLTQNEIYVAQEFSQTVRVIDGVTNQIAREFLVAGGSPIGELAFESNTNFLYVIQNDIKTIAILDYRDGAVLGTLPIAAHYGDLALNPQTQRLYVTSPLDNQVTVVDTANNAIVARLPVGKNPTRVTVNPATNRIYVAVSDDKALAVIDGATNAIVTTIALDESPGDIAVNPFTNRVYVAFAETKELAILDGNTHRIMTRLKLNAQLGQIAALPNLNRIYVTSNEAKGVFVIQDTPAASISVVSDERARVLRVDDAAPSNWTQPDFDDRAWGNAAARDCVTKPALGINADAKWIWLPDCSQYKETVLFRKTFEVPSARAHGALFVRANENAQVYLNGQELGAPRLWTTEYWFDLSPHLRQGKNVLALRGNHIVDGGYGRVMFWAEVSTR